MNKFYTLLCGLLFCQAALFAQNTTISTNFTNNNGQQCVVFNVENTNSTARKLVGLASAHFAASATPANVTVWYKTSAISGAPGAISTANGWVVGGTATVATTTTSSTFFNNLCIDIPANSTYGICLSSSQTIAYQTLAAGTYTFSGGGCNLITGIGVGFGGVLTGPTFTLCGFFLEVLLSAILPPMMLG
ncbi:MAG: hypothetical protein IPK03_10990 [Bacteroidetes bacterium]|nr:hypothetical protein [Bacteroidota bacterium]